MKRKGFTLIELLVVIAIIALLLSIIMPGLRKAKQKAQEVICRSNLKQWGLCYSLYAVDNDDSFPQSVGGNGLSNLQAYPLTAIKPYYDEQMKMRICPSTKVVERPWENYQRGSTFTTWGPWDQPSLNPTAWDWWDAGATGSYGLNDWCADPPPSPDKTYWGLPTENAVRKTYAKQGYLTPIMLDSVYVEAAVHMTDLPPTDVEHQLDNGVPAASWANNAIKHFCIDRHSGGIGGVFVDMSVRKVGLKELWRLKWHKKFDYKTAGPQSRNDWPEWMMKYKDYDYPTD